MSENDRLRIFHYSPWYTYDRPLRGRPDVENLSLFTLIYLRWPERTSHHGWESFIIHLDILNWKWPVHQQQLRIFHYSPWYTYLHTPNTYKQVENLSLFTLIYLPCWTWACPSSWESFIIHLDILRRPPHPPTPQLRIFHYSPWYTYKSRRRYIPKVENLSLFTLIYLSTTTQGPTDRWESFIIHLDILNLIAPHLTRGLRIFHYSPWYTYYRIPAATPRVENLSLFTLIYLKSPYISAAEGWESFIIHLDILNAP